jgi:hypothetical protein
VVPLFAFFLMKTRRIQESYIQSAAMHMKIVESLQTMEPARLRQLHVSALADFKDQWITTLLPEDE